MGVEGGGVTLAMESEPVFEDLLMIPGIDSQPGGRYDNPIFVVPARKAIHRLAESIDVHGYGLWRTMH